MAAIGGALVGLIGYAYLDPTGTSAFVGYKAAIYDPLLVVPVAVGLGVAVVVAGTQKARWLGLAAGAGAAIAIHTDHGLHLVG